MNNFEQEWLKLLQPPGDYTFKHEVKLIREFVTDEFNGALYLQRTGPNSEQKILLMLPPGYSADNESAPKLPGVTVPFYHPDAICGYNLNTLEKIRDGKDTIRFGLDLVKRGYAVAAPEAYPFNLIPEPAGCENEYDFKWWHEAARCFNEKYPQWSGMGKLCFDTILAIGLLASQTAVDADRLALIGHSLGGKMAFYAGCLDQRIKAFVCSDFGICWESSNWSAQWYWGDELAGLQKRGFEHGQLLKLNPDAEMLLICGEYDDTESQKYLQSYSDTAECRIHATGHAPDHASLNYAYQWLNNKLNKKMK